MDSKVIDWLTKKLKGRANNGMEEMDFSKNFRLKDISEETKLFYSEPGNPYETLEKSVLYWKEQLLIEIFYYEHGSDYFMSQEFLIYDKEDTGKLVEHYGSVDSLYYMILKFGTNGTEFKEFCMKSQIEPKREYRKLL